MFAYHDQRFRDILLLALGFFGVVWFFFDMKNHHPFSSIEVRMTAEEAIAHADSIFYNWEYQPVNLKKRAFIEADENLIDRIQAAYGREKYLSNTGSENYQQLPLYRWAVEEFSVTKEDVQDAVSFELSRDGELVSFKVSDEIIEEQTPANRKLIRAAFAGTPGYNRQREDSIISNLIEFQHMRAIPENVYEILLIAGDQDEGNFVWRGAEWYLENSYWKRFNFKRDSLHFTEDRNFRFARLNFTSTDTLMGVVPRLELELLPAGIIRGMSYELISTIPPIEPASKARSNALFGFLLIFIVWLLISFYLRIKARAIDTRPALIVAVVTGFLVPLMALLSLIKQLNVSFEAEQLSALFNQVLSFGVFGAVTSVSFFVAIAVSDSVTRQYWPDQLKTWDLVRRGMFKNKPVGWAIIRAVSIGSLLVGVYTILIGAFPEVFITGDINFIEDEFVFSPLANIIQMLMYSLAMVVLSFLILGNQVFASTQKKWLIPLVSALIFGAVYSIVSINPEGYGMLINAVIGFILGYFYIRYDFVTVALGYFIYANFIGTTSGWMVSNSPDGDTFIGFLILLFSLIIAGMYFLLVGEDKDSLPDYIPEYIEDQAKEQRVLQELDIARNIQVAFLPENTPEIPGFDASAICIPAQETGGDYYDIICLDDEKAAIAIGDVSGKGIQAAFYMTFTKGVIHSLCSIFPSPKMLMFRANKLFTENATRGTFISMIYGVLNVKERSFTYIRAGHNPMLYKKADGTISWLQPPGVALGMAKGEAFNKVSQEEKIQLDKGDVLVLYTDGITEAQNENEEFYDEKRLKRLIKREKTNSSKELRDLIIEDVRTFIGDSLQFDDMTLVVIKA